jgi:dTDP-4-amino-4,6-dideoxygalactose transaminase
MSPSLAFLGGEPTLTLPSPHADRCRFSSDDRDAINEYLGRNTAPNSVFGRTGIIEELENALAVLFGRKYCILTNSGTSALFSAYFAAGLIRGLHVLGPVYTFHSTLSPCVALGASVLLTDVELDTATVSVQSVESMINDSVRVIVGNHQWGHPFAARKLRRIADSRQCFLLEDVSLAVGSRLHGEFSGSIGHMACFSLGSSKLLSGGQGGAFLTDDRELYERATLVGHFEARSREAVRSSHYRAFCSTGFGHNFRMHVLAAAVARRRLHRLDELIQQRHQRYNLLSEYLNSTTYLRPPITQPGAFRGAWHGYCARVTGEGAEVGPEIICSCLRAEGLEVALGGYQPLLSEAPLFQGALPPFAPDSSRINNLSDKPERWPNARTFLASSIAFPLFLDEDISLIHQYGEALLKLERHLHDVRGMS